MTVTARAPAAQRGRQLALRPLLLVDHGTAPQELRGVVESVAHPAAAYDLVHVCPRDPCVPCWGPFGWMPAFLPAEAELAGSDLLRRVASAFADGVSIRTTLLPSRYRAVERVSALVRTFDHDVIVAPGTPPARWQILAEETRRWLVSQTLVPVIWTGV